MELTKEQVKELRNQFAHLSENEIKYLRNDYMTEKGLISRLERDNEIAAKKHAEPMPIYIEIEVNWKKSPTWGWNPHAEIRWEDEAGNWHFKEGYSVSGCGYDKHSSVVAQALNDNFSNLLYSIRKKSRKNKPYGISFHKGSLPYFEGGVGMSCYPRIFAWLGWHSFKPADSDTYDKWIFCKGKRGLQLMRNRMKA